MNANKILSYSIFYDGNNDKKFLPSLKNLAEDAKTTLYTTLEHLENLDKLEFGKSYYNVVSEDYRCYDYVPFGAHND